MTIEILPGTPADVRRCIQIQQHVFTQHPETVLVDAALFPNRAKGQGVDAAAEEETAVKRLEETIFGNHGRDVRFIKAVDTSLSGDEALVGFAKWNIYADGAPPLPPRQWGKDANAEACNAFFGQQDEMEDRLIGGKPFMCLKPVMTAAEHQRRGIGTKLIKWGLELAESLDLPVFLIASPIGHTLYQKCGFRDVEEITADLRKFGVEEPHTTWAMIWEKGNQST